MRLRLTEALAWQQRKVGARLDKIASHNLSGYRKNNSERLDSTVSKYIFKRRHCPWEMSSGTFRSNKYATHAMLDTEKHATATALEIYAKSTRHIRNLRSITGGTAAKTGIQSEDALLTARALDSVQPQQIHRLQIIPSVNERTSYCTRDPKESYINKFNINKFTIIKFQQHVWELGCDFILFYFILAVLWCFIFGVMCLGNFELIWWSTLSSVGQGGMEGNNNS